MITLRVWFLVITTALAVAVGAWTTLAIHARITQSLSASPAGAGAPSRGGSDAGHASSLGMNPETLEKLLRSAEPHLDVYGNEIEDAVTDYRIDSAGDVYESHSPDTEVPRLDPPLT